MKKILISLLKREVKEEIKYIRRSKYNLLLSNGGKIINNNECYYKNIHYVVYC